MLWGKTDTLASVPKFVARKAWFDASSANVVIAASDRINLIPSNTGFSTGDAVYYSINGGTAIGGLTDAATYYVRVVAAGQIELYDTYAHAVDTENTTGRVNITAVGAGNQTLQRTGAANPYDHNWNGKAIFFVDRSEAQMPENRAKGIKSGGWWLYSTYTDANSVVRHKASCLVAMDVLASDAGDSDTLAPEITIGTQPQDNTVFSGATVTFTVAATRTGTGTLAYQWQKQEGGAGAWANVSGATSSSYTTPALSVAADNADKYRAIVSLVGAESVTSSSATLTVNPAVVTIGTQPTNASVADGATATFSVAATVTGGATLAYQWQKQESGAGEWASVGGATSASYTTGTLSVADDNTDKYRVVVSANKEATPVTSTEVTLTVA